MKKFASYFVPCLFLGIIVAGCGSGAEKIPVKDSTVTITDTVPKMHGDSDMVSGSDSGTRKPLPIEQKKDKQ